MEGGDSNGNATQLRSEAISPHIGMLGVDGTVSVIGRQCWPLEEAQAWEGCFQTSESGKFWDILFFFFLNSPSPQVLVHPDRDSMGSWKISLQLEWGKTREVWGQDLQKSQ